MNSTPNLTTVKHLVPTEGRASVKGHKGAVLWLTGLSASGKSTIAMQAEAALHAKGRHVYVLDGDNIRRGLCKDLGFSDEDRVENNRRVGEVAALMADAGLIVIAAFISPFKADREKAAEACSSDFYEVYIKADLETCEKRDPKGLYKKARAGEINNFTGIDSPYEEPASAALVLDTMAQDVSQSVEALVSFIDSKVAV